MIATPGVVNLTSADTAAKTKAEEGGDTRPDPKGRRGWPGGVNHWTRGEHWGGESGRLLISATGLG